MMKSMNDVPDRVLNFGSQESSTEEPSLTPETLESHADKLPAPTGYRILILPFEPKATTRGGIMLAKQTLEKEKVAAIVGLVVSLGPSAYADQDKFPDGPWCKEGDWVIFGRYAGARFRIEGGDMRLLNDDEILAVISDPESILQ
jgi:co-chaperonin GroES (HSP10)